MDVIWKSSINERKKTPKFYVSSLQSKQHVPPESLETYLVLVYENLH